MPNKKSEDQVVRWWTHCFFLILFLFVAAFTVLYLYLCGCLPSKPNYSLQAEGWGAVGGWLAGVLIGSFLIYRGFVWFLKETEGPQEEEMFERNPLTHIEIK